MTLSAFLAQIPWLSLLIILPLTGALLCMLCDPRERTSRWLALVTTHLILAIAIGLFLLQGQVSPENGWLWYEDAAWIERFGIRFTLAMDGISLLLVLLTAFLQTVAVLMSWQTERHPSMFFALVLLLEAGIMGIFLAVDLVLFYMFWEIMIIPMFFLIGIWGHARRRYAALKFFLYTLAGSLTMLIALIALYLLHGEQTGSYTFALAELAQTQLTAGQEFWLFLGFMAAFAVKTPLVPFHTWLPDAHTEAPIAGTIDLTGLLLKTGVYGMIRVAFPLFPAATRDALPVLAFLALVGIFHAAWSAYRQDDVKRLFAYASISHLGLVVLGLAAWQTTAWTGSLLLLPAHGITTGGLFVIIAMIRRRTDTRSMRELGGLWGKAPNLSAMFLLFALASLGLPGLANFAGEILVLLGTFQTQPVWACLAFLGVVFAAAYMLRMVQNTLWGPPADDREIADLTPREWLILLPMAILTVWLGLYPAPFLAPLQEPVQLLLGGMP
ncbi:MAG TPA: NADH-quinone oxidoreductase subunit M [Desulfuromonadales bacterium]|nr:NADH-quinone oxidoreductase subunit M [Desulfuromonadales bacterium]